MYNHQLETFLRVADAEASVVDWVRGLGLNQ